MITLIHPVRRFLPYLAALFFAVLFTTIANNSIGGTKTPEKLMRPIGCADCTVLIGGNVFDGKSARAGTVVLHEGKIEDLVWSASGAATPVALGNIVDFSGKTILPGLIEMHTHVGSPDGSHSHYKAFLRSGVTTVLDTGAPQTYIMQERSDLRLGKTVGPRLFATGAIVTHTFGHGCMSDDPHTAFGFPFPPEMGKFCEFVDTPAQADAAVAAISADHPDFLKIVVESGTPGQPLPNITLDAIRAVVRAAARAGVSPIAHVGSAADVSAALDAGVLYFAHIPYEDRVSPDLARRLAESGAVVVPTLALTDAWARLREGKFDELKDPALPEDVLAGEIAELKDPSFLRKLGAPGWPYELAGKQTSDNHQANFRTYRKAGVKIIAGTDSGNAGVFYGLALRRELALYVENGMTPAEAISSATVDAANALGHPELGRIAIGAMADLLIVDGQPLVDIRDIARVHSVYKNGEMLDRAALAVNRP